MFATCLSTVPVAIKSRSAICLLVSPWAMSAATSSSRSDSRDHWSRSSLPVGLPPSVAIASATASSRLISLPAAKACSARTGRKAKRARSNQRCNWRSCRGARGVPTRFRIAAAAPASLRARSARPCDAAAHANPSIRSAIAHPCPIPRATSRPSRKLVIAPSRSPASSSTLPRPSSAHATPCISPRARQMSRPATSSVGARRFAPSCGRLRGAR